MKDKEAEKLIAGARIKVMSDSYTAFNGQRGTFIRLTGTHKYKGRLAKLTMDAGGVEVELPIETFEIQ